MTESANERRWMILPKNAAYPNFNEVHREDGWCAKVGCVPVSDECVRAGKYVICEVNSAAPAAPHHFCGICGESAERCEHSKQLAESEPKAAPATESPSRVWSGFASLSSGAQAKLLAFIEELAELTGTGPAPKEEAKFVSDQYQVKNPAPAVSADPSREKETRSEPPPDRPNCDYTGKPSLDSSQLCRCGTCQLYARMLFNWLARSQAERKR